jgi:hypothetical protein
MSFSLRSRFRTVTALLETFSGSELSADWWRLVARKDDCGYMWAAPMLPNFTLQLTGDRVARPGR